VREANSHTHCFSNSYSNAADYAYTDRIRNTNAYFDCYT
jgi:hypothetical protein